MLKIQRYIFGLMLIIPSISQASGAQDLSSPRAVIDALNQNHGDVLLAFIDSPSDQSSPLRNFQGLLSVYKLDLNNVALGTVRRNTVLHVRPRLGLNRLRIQDAYNTDQMTEVAFPAMRSAGIPTSIVEIRTSRQFQWMEAIQLTGSEVQTIKDALNRDSSGGMSRVLQLIRSRGKEIAKPKHQRVNWSRGVVSQSFGGDSNSDSGSDGESTTQSSRPTSSDASVNASEDTATMSSEASDPVSDTSAEVAADTEANSSSSNVSADRRSYY